MCRWELLLKKYPKAEKYLDKRLGGSNFPRWGAPWLQSFTASSTSSSRGEGANKDLKADLKKARGLTLLQAYNHIKTVHEKKRQKEQVRQIRTGTAFVDARKLTAEWFPELTTALRGTVSGYCEEKIREQMGSSGNYRVAAIIDNATVPEEGDLTGLGLAAEVEEVQGGNLDLSAFVCRLQDASVRDKDPFRRSGVATFLERHPGLQDFRILQVENMMHAVSQYLVFYDAIQLDQGAKVYKQFWCTCGEVATAGYPCRHFFAAHRHVQWAGFHLHQVLPRWQLREVSDTPLLSYGNKNAVSVVSRPEDQQQRTTTQTVGDSLVQVPVDVHRETKRTYGKVWGLARTAVSLLCMDNGKVYKEEVQELVDCINRVSEKVRQKEEMEAAAPQDRSLVKALQSCTNVQDIYRPDQKKRGLRKCSNCGSTGHNKARCPHPKKGSAKENLVPSTEGEEASPTPKSVPATC